MAVVLQMYFERDGVWGKEYVPIGTSRAESINEEEGFIWKIWTEDAPNHHAGGIYLFDTRENAAKYITMHEARLAKMGFTNFVSKIFEVNEGLTVINKGPLAHCAETKVK
jgi:hypothetical protein